MTHFIPYDAPKHCGRDARALCGRLILLTDHHHAPDCTDCQQALAEDEAAIAALREDTKDQPATCYVRAADYDRFFEGDEGHDGDEDATR